MFFERGPRWWFNLSGLGLAVVPKLGYEWICQDVCFSIGDLPARVPQIRQPNLSSARSWGGIGAGRSLGPCDACNEDDRERNHISCSHVNSRRRRPTGTALQ